MYFSGEEGKHEYGVGFLVHKDLVGAVLGCQPVSSRLISIRLRYLLIVWGKKLDLYISVPAIGIWNARE